MKHIDLIASLITEDPCFNEAPINYARGRPATPTPRQPAPTVSRAPSQIATRPATRPTTRQTAQTPQLTPQQKEKRLEEFGMAYSRAKNLQTGMNKIVNELNLLLISLSAPQTGAIREHTVGLQAALPELLQWLQTQSAALTPELQRTTQTSRVKQSQRLPRQ